MPRLFVLPEASGDQPLELNDNLVLVGREPDNLLQIEDSNISKRHALLVKMDDTYQVYDLHSANGTYVNDERVMTIKLKDGDRLQFGSATFRYQTGRAPKKIGLKLSSQGKPGSIPSPATAEPVTPPPPVPSVPPLLPTAPVAAPVATPVPKKDEKPKVRVMIPAFKPAPTTAPRAPVTAGPVAPATPAPASPPSLGTPEPIPKDRPLFRPKLGLRLSPAPTAPTADPAGAAPAPASRPSLGMQEPIPKNRPLFRPKLGMAPAPAIPPTPPAEPDDVKPLPADPAAAAPAPAPVSSDDAKETQDVAPIAPPADIPPAPEPPPSDEPPKERTLRFKPSGGGEMRLKLRK